MKEDYIIRLEQKEDYFEVENVVRNAFWNVYRPGCLEHFVLHSLRNDAEFIKELDFVMVKGGIIIGQVIYVKAEINDDDGLSIPVLTMGPICIAPEYKRKGYGKILLDYSLEKAKEWGAGAVCLEGNIDFYGKSGFIVASKKDIHYNGEERNEEVPYFLIKELKDNYLSGVKGTYSTPTGYFVDENAAEEFDKAFPYKVKEKLPCQLF